MLLVYLYILFGIKCRFPNITSCRSLDLFLSLGNTKGQNFCIRPVASTDEDFLVLQAAEFCFETDT